jgi:hypothetical protein
MNYGLVVYENFHYHRYGPKEYQDFITQNLPMGNEQDDSSKDKKVPKVFISYSWSSEAQTMGS